MSVAAFLPSRLLTHVKHVLADEPEIFVASSWQELESFICRKPISLVILDPPQFNAVAQLGRLGLKEVVLHHFDDEPEGFRERVERVEANALTHDVIEALRDRLVQLPRQLSLAVENLFDPPHPHTSAPDL